MKKWVYGVLGILMMSLAACSSSDDKVENGEGGIPKELIGTWKGYKWQRKIHNESGKLVLSEDGTLDYVLIFDKDGICLWQTNNTVQNTKDYSVKGNKLIYDKTEYTIQNLTENELCLSRIATFQENLKEVKSYYFHKAY